MMRIDFYGDWVSDKVGAINIMGGSEHKKF